MSLIYRLFRYGVVGVIASGTYAVATFSIISLSDIGDVIASVIGYLLAMPVSYVGQRYFTFRSQGAIKSEIPRFILVQGANLVLAATVMAVSVHWFDLGSIIGIICVIILIPLMTFIAMSIAVFRDKRA